MQDQNMHYKTRHSVEEPVFLASRHRNSWVKDAEKNKNSEQNLIGQTFYCFMLCKKMEAYLEKIH